MGRIIVIKSCPQISYNDGHAVVELDSYADIRHLHFLNIQPLPHHPALLGSLNWISLKLDEVSAKLRSVWRLNNCVSVVCLHARWRGKDTWIDFLRGNSPPWNLIANLITNYAQQVKRNQYTMQITGFIMQIKSMVLSSTSGYTSCFVAYFLRETNHYWSWQEYLYQGKRFKYALVCHY